VVADQILMGVGGCGGHRKIPERPKARIRPWTEGAQPSGRPRAWSSTTELATRRLVAQCWH
jgi:hypothetical protein